MQCPAFSVPFKVLATTIVWGGVAWLYSLWSAGAMGNGGTSTGLGWFVAGLALMVYTWWHLITGRTTLSTEAIEQTWVWHKKLELRELAYGKLIRVRGLEWLIAPRLYVRTLGGKFTVFYAADPTMVADFERLVQELKAFRQM